MSAKKLASLPDEEFEERWAVEWQTTVIGASSDEEAREMAAKLEAGPLGKEIRRRREEGFQKYLKMLTEEEAKARADFLNERIAALPKKQRPDAAAREDLDRRLRTADTSGALNGMFAVLQLLDEGVKPGQLFLAEMETARAKKPASAAWSVLLAAVESALGGQGYPEEFEALYEPEEIRAAYRLFLAMVWPEAWRKHQLEWLPAGDFRIPMESMRIGQVVGAKRFGTEEGLPVRYGLDDGKRITKIRVSIPKGGQLELGSPGIYIPTADDFDDEGHLRPDVLFRAMGEVTGPEVAMIFYVCHAMATEDALREERDADGRFWWWPSRAAEMLGYRKESRGKDRPPQFSRSVIQAIQGRFDAFSGLILDLEIRRPGTKRPVPLEGKAMQRWWRENTPEPGKPGRRVREQWQINPELWRLGLRYSVQIPIEALHAGDMRPADWAVVFQVYLAMVGHARNNAEAVRRGKRLVLSEEALHSMAKVLRAARLDLRGKRLWGYLEKLEERGLLREVSQGKVKTGGAAIEYLLPPRQAEGLAKIAEAAERKLALSPPPRRRRRRKG